MTCRLCKSLITGPADPDSGKQAYMELQECGTHLQNTHPEAWQAAQMIGQQLTGILAIRFFDANAAAVEAEIWQAQVNLIGNLCGTLGADNVIAVATSVKQAAPQAEMVKQ